MCFFVTPISNVNVFEPTPALGLGLGVESRKG